MDVTPRPATLAKYPRVPINLRMGSPTVANDYPAVWTGTGDPLIERLSLKLMVPASEIRSLVEGANCMRSCGFGTVF